MMADVLSSNATGLSDIGNVCLDDVQFNSVFIESGGQVSPFLIEGCAPGTGDLTLIVKKDGIEICRKAVRLTLKSISEFYEKYVVAVTTNDDVSTISVLANTCTYTPANNGYILYVHGWNMEGWEKRRWTETVFKRLWWQGYQGSVTLFDWPTLYDFSGFWDVVTNPHHFDNSEYRAWQSANALASVMTELNDGGNLRVLAHSMGNVATGEALQKYGAHPLLPPVHTYIACQAALSAHYYDNTVAANNPCGYRVFDITFQGTPDIIGHAYTGDADSRPYLVENSAHVVNLQNWYNPDILGNRFYDVRLSKSRIGGDPWTLTIYICLYFFQLLQPKHYLVKARNRRTAT